MIIVCIFYVFAESKSFEDFWIQPTLLRVLPRLGLNVETGIDLLCLIGIVLSLLAMVSGHSRDSINFTVMWICYFSVFKVEKSAKYYLIISTQFTNYGPFVLC